MKRIILIIIGICLLLLSGCSNTTNTGNIVVVDNDASRSNDVCSAKKGSIICERYNSFFSRWGYIKIQ